MRTYNYDVPSRRNLKTFYLSPETLQDVQRVATSERISQSELMRRALQNYIQNR